ncbi:MAG TPA: hypothetical protein VGB17_11645 [Pyrinomonadaceae bacterium]
MPALLRGLIDLRRPSRLASIAQHSSCAAEIEEDYIIQLELNDKTKEIVQELGSAINSAVEDSSQVAAAIERLREAGYEMELTLRLEIGLRALEQVDAEAMDAAAVLELTDEDLHTLRSMKIRIDDGEFRPGEDE